MRRSFRDCAVALFAAVLAGCDPAAREPARQIDRQGARPTPLLRPMHSRRLVPASDLMKESARDAHGYPLVTVDALEAVTLVRNGEFSRATALLRSLQSSFDQDFRNEHWPFDGYLGFEIADAGLTVRLDEWCAAEPGSEAAWAAWGIHRSALGWAARGTKWASDTSAEQFRAMEEQFGRARMGLQQALRLRPSLLVAHVELMDVARAGSDVATLDEIYRLGLAVQPLSFHLRRAYLLSLLPRWGGSYEQMQTALSAWEPLLAKNPRLGVLQGFVAWDKGRTGENGDAEVARFAEALSHGHVAEFYVSRAHVERALNQYPVALADAETAVALHPNLADAHVGRARALYSLQRYEEALVAVERASALDPADASCRKWRTWCAEDLVSRGYKSPVARQTDEALRLLGLAAEFDPSSGKAAYWTGQVLLKAGQHERALPHVERAVTLDPRDFDAHRSLDFVLARRGEWHRIVAAWDAFLLLEPRHAQAWLERAGAKKHGGDKHGALADLRAACDLGSPQACAFLARPGRP